MIGILTFARHSAHASPVTEKDVTGFSGPSGAAISRTAATALRLFCRLGASSFGRPGGEPQGSPVLHRSANPFGRPPHLAVREAVTYRNWSTIMAHIIEGASAPTRTTAPHSFVRVNPNGDLLFEVRPGVSLIDALEMASCYLSTARDLCAEMGMHGAGETTCYAWGSHYLLELAHAVMQSAIKAASEEKRDHE